MDEIKWPGEVLREKLCEQNYAFEIFCRDVCISPRLLNLIFYGRYRIDEFIAKKIVSGLPDTTPEYWMELENAYQEYEIEREKSPIKVYIVKYALTSGIFMKPAQIRADRSIEIVTETQTECKECYYEEHVDWCKTASEALELAEVMRKQKIESLEREIQDIRHYNPKIIRE